MDNSERVFITKKNGKGNSYNYDLYEMINNFSLIDFCDDVKKLPNPLTANHGGFVVITDKQYIAGYNAGFGEGTHMGAGARIYKELHGGGDITSDNEARLLSTKCDNDYLTARIIYECTGENYNRRPMFGGYIHFSFANFRNNKSISTDTFKAFIKFCNDYEKEISILCNNYNFRVSFAYYEGEKLHSISTNSFTEAIDVLRTLVDNNKEVNDNEYIIGVSTSSRVK